jgi:type I site-specific restriction endonuclease
MESKKLFPNFWRRQQDQNQNEDAPAKSLPKEAPMNTPNPHAAQAANSSRADLLSYDDIYHAAGIMSPRSGYGIHKVVEMLNSERIRALAKDIQRASVLMALDAAGASVDQLLQDATRRQHALDSYEDGQRKQIEEFEARKAQENTQLQAEMERLTAHYAERIQHNLDQVAREKEMLRNWQMAKQHESQRISEVVDLCSKQPEPAKPEPSVTAASPTSAPLQPSLVTKASAGR